MPKKSQINEYSDLGKNKFQNPVDEIEAQY